ncbi:MAG: hypothetical protein ACK40D_08285 [Cyanobacteriota bacterium]|jgi:coproporphyrinogen III oxidase-like Fe-S oxidoreductase
MLTSAGPAPASLLPLELLLKHDKPVPRYTSFPTAAAFHSGVGAEALATELATSSEAPLSIYVHVPFCRHACWYCGCHRITTQLLDRRRLIQNVMCRFQTKLALARYAKEWRCLQNLAADGLVRLQENEGMGHMEVCPDGRWLLRTIAAVFDPQQQRQPHGARIL